MNHAKYSRLTAGLIAAWFVFALSASLLHVFQSNPGQPPLAVGLAVVIPIVLFFVLFAALPGFRQFALSLNPRILTFVQSWRVVGFTFLVLYSTGLLPGLLALPAGWGDIAIGATAPLAATQLMSFNRRTGFVVWQLLGILDLVMALALGVWAGMTITQGPGTALMAVLPLSLLPTFVVPLFILLHFVCIAQARHWDTEQSLPVGEPLASSI